MNLRNPIKFSNSSAKKNSKTNLGLDAELVYYAIAITVQGNTAGASTVTIQLKDHAGNNIEAVDYLRVRICNNGVLAASTNAVLAAGTNTTAMETMASNKDYILKSHTNGLFTVTVTDATAETVTLRIGPPTVAGRRGDYTAVQQIVHAAP